MQTVIMCGGIGTRLREQTEFLPKPMIKIGPYPIVVHIMKMYKHWGFDKFILALGYKQEVIKHYFTHYDMIRDDITPGGFKQFSIGHVHSCSEWQITLSDTSENTLKGGRLKRIEKYIDSDPFMMTYGDGVSNINIPELLGFHKSHGKLATVTGVRPMPRFGQIQHERGRVCSYMEKNDDGCLINGGFYVLDRKVLAMLTPDESQDWEIGPLEELAKAGELMVYEHKGFWACMDNLNDLSMLQKLWAEGKAAWKVWE